MRTIITVFKAEFKGKEEVSKRLSDLASISREVEGACIYSPKSGKLMEFLDILKDNKIDYGVHFNTAEDQT